jgi:hypothetical protein
MDLPSKTASIACTLFFFGCSSAGNPIDGGTADDANGDERQQIMDAGATDVGVDATKPSASWAGTFSTYPTVYVSALKTTTIMDTETISALDANTIQIDDFMALYHGVKNCKVPLTIAGDTATMMTPTTTCSDSQGNTWHFADWIHNTITRTDAKTLHFDLGGTIVPLGGGGSGTSYWWVTGDYVKQ